MRARTLIAGLAAASLLLLHVQPGFTQASEELNALKSELEALRMGQAAIRRELEEIKSLLRARAGTPATPPRNVALSVKGNVFKGERNARVTLIEFSDYQCPFCSRHVRETLPQLEREYIATGKLKYVLRDFPIQSIHPQAFMAHEASRCAGDQGIFWKMHDRLFANQRALGVEDLVTHAREINLDVPIFQQCLDSGRHASTIRQDVADAQAAGVSGTPTFFVGLTEPDEAPVKALQIIRGAQPYAAFKEAIENLLAATAR